VPHAVEPRPLVLYAFLGVDVLAFTVSEAVLDVALESRAVGPLVTAETSDLVVPELSLVDGAVCPAESTLSVKETVLELSLVGVTIPELAGALPVIDFADLKEYEKFEYQPFSS
jgi:hypothetical protein